MLEDVNSKSDCGNTKPDHDTPSSSELCVGSRDWSRRSRDIAITAQRDAIGDAQQLLIQRQFDQGLVEGFRLIRESALIRGRLTTRLQLFELNRRQQHEESRRRDLPRQHLLIKQLGECLKSLESSLVEAVIANPSPSRLQQATTSPLDTTRTQPEHPPILSSTNSSTDNSSFPSSPPPQISPPLIDRITNQIALQIRRSKRQLIIFAEEDEEEKEDSY